MVLFSARRLAVEALKKFTPMFDRVVIEKAVAETQTKSGIMLPEKSMGKVLEGTVLAAGPGARAEDGKVLPISLKVGDRVLLPEYGGSKIVIEDKEYFLYRESEVLGKWNP
nr:mitochondrial 10 kDa heat shock protein [Diamesa zernyi]